MKTQCLTFDGRNPQQFKITLNNKNSRQEQQFEILRLHPVSWPCCVDYGNNTRNFYRNFNNILSLIGKGKQESTTVHLAKTYCLLTRLHAREVWNLTSSHYHHMNVLWNNMFRKMLTVAGEKAECIYFITMFFQCRTLLINK